MSEDLYVTVNGLPCSWCRVTVGYIGAWTAEVRLPVDTELTTPITLRVGKLTLVGSQVADMNGAYMTQRQARIAGGKAAWGNDVAPRGYHNDAGVKARLVVEDIAREIGETLGTFIPAAERVGIDFAREAGPASRALERCIGSTSWWVDYAGVTQVGPRPSSTPDPGAYELLAYDPSDRIASFTADDPSVIQVGAMLPEGTVRDLEIVAGGDDALRINAWLGGSGVEPARLAGLLRAIAQRATDGRLFGLYRYQVTSQGADDRLNLRAVSEGVPDLKLITAWQGIAGTRSRVTVGSEVLVQFIAGDRAQPVVVAYAPYKGNAFAPAGIVLGGAAGEPAARKGDAVAMALGTFTATIGTVSTTCTITAWQSDGVIKEGSDVVSIAPEAST